VTASVQFSVRVIPNARQNVFSGRREGELVLRLTAPAVDDKANKAAVDFISRFFGVPKSSVLLVRGERSRHKIFQIVGLEPSDLERKLAVIDR
jgi:uncharacterized protein (TIGR00251 family)